MDLENMIELANMLKILLLDGYRVCDYAIDSTSNHVIIVNTVDQNGNEKEFFFFMKKFSKNF